MSLVGRLHDVIRRLGYEVTPHPLARLVDGYRPDVIVDVGANRGQFGQEIRRRGYRGRIVSFEPHPGAFRDLEAAASGDRCWEVRNEALGDAEGMLDLHLGEKDYTSSLLAPSDALRQYADVEFVGTKAVPVRRLDAVFEGVWQHGERVALKVDTQGYERAVIAGAARALEHVEAVLLELSFVPLYESEPPAEVVVAQLREAGFVPAYLTPAFTEAGSRRWLQADVLFFRGDAS
ncbi:MAG: FkbM family methyltransferase [Bacteroidota bacterium]